MSFLLNLIYICGMVLLSPYLVWRIVVQRKNRDGFGEKFLGLCPTRRDDSPCVWFHAVSVGEVKLLKPVIDQLVEASPDLQIAVSSTTKTGRKLAREIYPQHITFYSPLDFSWAVRRVLKRIRPSALVLAELELWPNLIQITSSLNVPVCVINGRLSARSARGYKRFSFLVRPMFQRLAWVGAQSEHYATRFVDNGCDINKVTVTGSVKFDGVETNRKNPDTMRLARIARQAEITSKHFTFVAGSTQFDEDVIVAKAWQKAVKTNDRLRLIFVPRHPGRSLALADMLNGMGIPTVLRSSLEDGFEKSRTSPASRNAGTKDHANNRSLPAVLIVDVIGELSAWWGLADSGFVGGSMGSRGGQSMIEPAGFGVPVCFGPNTENFADTVGQLIDNEAAEIVQNEKQLLAFIQWSSQMKHLSTAMGERAQQVVTRNMGAADRTVKGLLDRLEEPPAAASTTGRSGQSGKTHQSQKKAA